MSAVDVDLRAAGHIRLDGPLNSERCRCHPVCRIDVPAQCLRLGRRSFPILGHRSWAGNWCWDAVWVTRPVLVDLVVYLHGLGKFDLDEAPPTIWDAWQETDPATLRNALDRALRQSVAPEAGAPLP